MKVSKTVKHHINMGNYEWMEVSATAEVDGVQDYKAMLPSELAEIDDTINKAMAKDLQKAYAATDEDGSYVNELIKMEN